METENNPSSNTGMEESLTTEHRSEDMDTTSPISTMESEEMSGPVDQHMEHQDCDEGRDTATEAMDTASPRSCNMEASEVERSVSSRPINDVNESATDMVETANDIRKSPTDVIESANDVGESPIDVKEYANDVGESPTEVVESANDVGETPTNVTESAKDVCESPTDVITSANDVGETPTEVIECANGVGETGIIDSVGDDAVTSRDATESKDQAVTADGGDKVYDGIVSESDVSTSDVATNVAVGGSAVGAGADSAETTSDTNEDRNEPMFQISCVQSAALEDFPSNRETSQSSDTATGQNQTEESTTQSVPSEKLITKIKTEPVDNIPESKSERSESVMSDIKLEPEATGLKIASVQSVELGDSFDKTDKESKQQKSKSEKTKSRKQHKCLVCGNIGKCKYNIVRNGNVKHLCNDVCFKTFRTNPSSFLTNQSEEPPALPPPLPVHKPCCAFCNKALDTSLNYLTWQALDFCSEICLRKFQIVIPATCGSCEKTVPSTLGLKHCAAVGKNVKKFCCGNCQESFLKSIKTCSYCCKELTNDVFWAPVNDSTTSSIFCSKACHQANELRASCIRSSLDSRPSKEQDDKRSSRSTRSASGLATCAVCGKMTNYKHEITHENKKQRMCSDQCFAAYRYARKISSNLCDHCNTPCDHSARRIHFEGMEKKFCNLTCLEEFRIQRKRQVPCNWCAVSKSITDMIEKGENGKIQLFCSPNCMALFRVNIQSTGTKAVSCDQCFQQVPAQYHLTMSDASIRNFCSYNCVMVFQNQFKTPTVNKPRLPGTPGQVVVRGLRPKMNGSMLKQAEPDSVPIISNVMSLAPTTPTQQTKAPAQKETVVRKETIVQKETIVKKETLIHHPPASLNKNRSTMCKPLMMSKATTCRPHSANKSCQTDDGLLSSLVVPLPVPIYVPVPVAFYQLPTPQPVPIPVPVPIPCFIPTGSGSADQILSEMKDIRERIPNDPFEADLLMMAEAVANDESPKKEEKAPEEPLFTNDADMLSMALKMAEQISSEEPQDLETSLDNMERTRGTKRAARARGRGRPKKPRLEEEEEEEETPAADAKCVLKFTYGVNAWKHWVKQKNQEIEKLENTKLRLFKTDLLACSAEELNYALCLFVKEVRKPNGEAYAADSIFYLCLGIQAFLFTNHRLDNIFTDVYYEKFTECMNEILVGYKPRISPSGQLLCRIEEEHLWECKQLGAHSPHVLLNTLIYFNTRYFQLHTEEQHIHLAFSHVVKAWKRKQSGSGKSVYLKYFVPKDRRLRDGNELYEQYENTENPLRCPVKLFEFYVSKCPESIKNRSDLFYLVPERSCVPDSPVWYSCAALESESLSRMLNRLKLVKELQDDL